jgi:hypothetical protein
MSAHPSRALLLALVVAGCVAHPVGWAARLSEAQSRSIDVACSPEKPLVSIGDTIALTAWANSRGGRTFKYDWAATGGKLTSLGDQAQWRLDDVHPGTYRATVTVRDATGSADCSVLVIVRPQLREPPGRESGWAFLLRNEVEEKDYGLYSYVLFGSTPSSQTRDRYLEVIDAYLQAMPAIRSLEKVRIPRRELNIVYLPLDTDRTPAEAGSVSAGLLLESYDYARARALLRVLPGARRNGPYLVSALGPLDAKRGSGDHYLIQDLSSVPPHLAGLWMKEFLNQTAQERFWQEQTTERLAVKLRTTVSIVARGLPEVMKGLDTLIVWVR